jgi:hypothetical protein
MITLFLSWLRHRRQLKVARRIAALKAEIAALDSLAASAREMGKKCPTFQYDAEAGNFSAEAAKKRVILSHNLQHEDCL